MLEEVQDYGNGHVVREVGHQRRRIDGQLRDLHGVGKDQVEIVLGLGAPFPHRLGQFSCQDGVDLHGHDILGRIEESERQGTQSGSHFQYGLVGIDGSRCHDPADGVSIDHKVLPQCFRGAYTDFLGEPSDVGCAHQRRDGGGFGIRFSHLGIVSPVRGQAACAQPQSLRPFLAYRRLAISICWALVARFAVGA
ncbi:hypothetical protein PJL18_03044 [Paenarthrobacter nicotinovorans]|nr:hypothetical protein [Paenarthrobacter nicotinovorans]